MFLTDKSSMQIVWFSQNRRVESLCSIITPSISYLRMDTGNLETSLVAVLGTLILLESRR